MFTWISMNFRVPTSEFTGTLGTRKNELGNFDFWAFWNAALCCVPLNWWTRDHKMVITGSRLGMFTDIRIYLDNKLRPVCGPGSRDSIWGPSSPGSRNYMSISQFSKSCHQPYSSQSIVTCMPQFPGLLNCWIISGMLVSVSDRNATMPICRMNCIWKHCLLLTENYV